MDAVVAWLIITGFVVLVAIKGMKDAKEWNATPPNLGIVCPHCRTEGRVKTRRVTRKKRISARGDVG